MKNINLKKLKIIKFNTQIIGKFFECLNAVDSTQDIAKQNIDKNGYLVISLDQTKGRGRENRKWESGLGGLWFSFVLKPNIDPKDSDILVKLVSVSILEILLELDKNKFGLKWPNDIMLNKNGSWKKLGGILIDTSSTNNRFDWIIAGIGLNINNEISKNLENTAANLKYAFKKIDIYEIFKKIIENLDKNFLNFDKNYIESIYKKHLI